MYGANLLDITPTVLTLFGLPVGKDMAGRVIGGIFAEPPKVQLIPTWEDEAGVKRKAEPLDPEAAKALVEQFVALGYMEPLTGDQSAALERTIASNRMCLAMDLIDAGKTADAIPILEDLRSSERVTTLLARCYLRTGRRSEALALLEPGASEPACRVSAGCDSFPGRARGQGDGTAHDSFYRPISGRASRHRTDDDAQVTMGDALAAFERAVELGSDSVSGHVGVASACLKLRRNEEAADHALTAVGLRYYMPRGHYVLGLALARLGHWERAEVALRAALTMSPEMKAARRVMAAVLRRKTAAALAEN